MEAQELDFLVDDKDLDFDMTGMAYSRYLDKTSLEDKLTGPEYLLRTCITKETEDNLDCLLKAHPTNLQTIFELVIDAYTSKLTIKADKSDRKPKKDKAQAVDLLVDTKPVHLELTGKMYNRYVNDASNEDKTSPPWNLLVNAVTPETKETLVGFLDAHPTHLHQIFEAAIKEYKPDIVSTVKKSKRKPKHTTKTA
ncbi:MAG: hypothetical protein HRT35_07375 [Algicola sp.]|nr:hypothetical protein [Algicola sp.]